jgi:hypothetical protein
MGDTAIGTGDWITGQTLDLRYDSAADAAAGAWIHVNPTTAFQVSFPATQVASTDVNTLDDYEEGAWTPAIKFGGASVSMTYTTQAGRYNKIGKTVTVWLDLILSAKGSSTGTMTITGLPFTVGSVSSGGSIGYLSDFSVTGMRISAGAASTVINCYGGTGLVIDDTAVTTNVAHINATITYEASA